MTTRHQTELAVLRALEHGESYPKEVAESAGVTVPTAWKVLKDLATRGLVRKSRIGRGETQGRPRQYWDLTRFGVLEIAESKTKVMP